MGFLKYCLFDGKIKENKIREGEHYGKINGGKKKAIEIKMREKNKEGKSNMTVGFH